MVSIANERFLEVYYNTRGFLVQIDLLSGNVGLCVFLHLRELTFYFARENPFYAIIRQEVELHCRALTNYLITIFQILNQKQKLQIIIHIKEQKVFTFRLQGIIQS